jgi:hypothetical protein
MFVFIREHDITNNGWLVMRREYRSIEAAWNDVVIWNDRYRGRLSYRVIPDRCVRNIFGPVDWGGEYGHGSRYAPDSIVKFWKETGI